MLKDVVRENRVPPGVLHCEIAVFYVLVADVYSFFFPKSDFRFRDGKSGTPFPEMNEVLPI